MFFKIAVISIITAIIIARFVFDKVSKMGMVLKVQSYKAGLPTGLAPPGVKFSKLLLAGGMIAMCVLF